MSVELTSNNFNEVVLNSEKTVLVDFWAEWCGPCRVVGPIVDALSKEYEGKAIIGKLNVDKYPGLSIRFGIMNIPTLLIFRNGQIVDKQMGAVAKSVLANKLNAQITK